jgi:uncharacterized membrane protein YeaQ/YmgE (transglycosylase-associated protein family)
MIGMDFGSFLVLLVISVVVSAALHYGFKFYARGGTASFLSKVIIGWIGAWLGSPVFGHWFEGVQYEQVYIVPAILGSLAILILVVDVVQTCGEVCTCTPTETGEVTESSGL